MKKLGKTYTSPLQNILEDEENCQIVASYMEPLPKKKLKTSFSETDNQINNDQDKQKIENDDDLACNDDVYLNLYFLKKFRILPKILTKIIKN